MVHGAGTTTGWVLDLLKPAAWKPLTDMPEARVGAAGAAWGGKIMLLGGSTDYGQTLATEALVYDLAGDSWDTIDGPPRPLARAVVACGAI